MWAMLMTVLLAQANSGSNATVEFSVAPCDFQTGRSFSGATLKYTVSGPDGSEIAGKAFVWNSNDPTPLRWSASVPSGVYRYSVFSNVQPLPNATPDVPCEMNGSFAILPRSIKRIRGSMQGGIDDPLALLYIYGTAPAGVKLSVMRFDAAAGCGGKIPVGQGHPILVDRDAVGYFASDSALSGDAKGKQVVFGIRVQRQDESRTLRVIADYPSENIAAPPTSVRFDITQDMLEAAFTRSGDVLFCAPR
jgi:hypothetical protein